MTEKHLILRLKIAEAKTDADFLRIQKGLSPGPELFRLSFFIRPLISTV